MMTAATTTMIQQQHRDDDFIYYLRGPVIGAFIVLSVLLPTLLQLSWMTWIRGLLFLTACGLALYDGTRLVLKYSRRALQRNIHRIVLDDVLCAIFHPQTGILSVMCGMFVGNAALYSFPTTLEQRVQLVQHALDGTGLLSVEEEEVEEQNRNRTFNDEKIPAHEILLEPGGFLRLAPAAVQEWFRDDKLQDDESDGRQKSQTSHTVAMQHDKKRQARGDEDENSTASETSSVLVFCHSENGRAGNPSDETPVRHPPEDNATGKSEQRQTIESINWVPPRKASQSPNKRHTATTSTRTASKDERQQEQQQQHQQRQQLRHRLPLPNEIVRSILQDWTTEHVQRLFQSIPDNGSLETICVAATTLLCLQFRYSRRARELLWSTLQASAAMGGTTALLVSILALVIKHRFFVMDSSSSSSNDNSAAQTTNPSTATTTTMLLMNSRNACKAVWSSLRTLASVEGVKFDWKKWQGILAAIVLFYFGRRRRRSSRSQPSMR